jgi:hypothetical protein
MGEPATSLIAFLRARLDEEEARAKDDFVCEPIAVKERALREVAAKRAIVTRCAAVLQSFDDRENGMWPDVSRRERSHAYATLCDLATIDSDHPDYQQKWAPERGGSDGGQ